MRGGKYMHELDRVKLLVEKERYAKEGVHKGMDGIICDPRNINGQWLVSFDQYGDLPEIACISVKEEDLEVVYQHHQLEVGDKVMLYVDDYTNDGVPLGAIGDIIKAGSDSEHWIVRFQVGEPLKEIDLDLYYDYISTNI